MSRRIKIVHIITGLNTGGAEMMLFKITTGLDKNQYDIKVVSLINVGAIGQKLINSGIDVVGLNMKPNTLIVSFLKLLKQLKEFQPDVVQTWMYHADLLGGIAAKLAGVKVVIWNVRQSLKYKENKLSTRMVIKICKALSFHLPEKIICCSQKATNDHIKIGYDSSKFVLIPNGFNTDEYHPDNNQRSALRNELGINNENILIGTVARYHPQKDYHTLLAAFNELMLNNINEHHVHLIACGDGVSSNNLELQSLIPSTMNDFIHLMGKRNDVAKIMAGLDIFVLSSAFGEGFPNVVGEAMACGVPCIVTDVGDAAYIVGDTGTIIPPGDCKALKFAFNKYLNMSYNERKIIGNVARNRIIQKFSIQTIVSQYSYLYLSVL